MLEHRIIHPAAKNTVQDLGSGGPVTLPSELVEDSRRRVGTAAIAFALMWLVGLVMNLVIWPLIRDPAHASEMAWNGVVNVAGSLGLLFSVAIALVARHRTLSTRTVLRAGIAFQIGCAALVALATHDRAGERTLSVSWVCLIILAYPMIAPMSAWKTLAAGLTCAAIDTLVFFMWRHGNPGQVGAFPTIWILMPSYLCALMAVVPSRMITRLGRQVRHEQEMGSYMIGELLGRGGMGEVYSAKHRLLARPAAIKLIQRRLLEEATPENARAMVERFHREAEAVAALRSPHTVSLYDFGVTDEGTMFYVMELLDGMSMEELVWRHGPVPEERAVHLLRQVCLSLAEAHARGLLHRDIKPGNIHVCRLGGAADFVKVLDFGLVKGTQREITSNANLTAPGAMAGTPSFMPPELFVGDASDERSDVYAIGCVAYWLLTGRLVFEGPSMMRIITQVLTDDPIPVSTRSAMPISVELESLVMRCLSRDPALRPRDAGELGELLERCRSGCPWTARRAEQWWAAHVDEAAA